MNNTVEILILSFDGFEDLWAPCIDSFLGSWTDCPYKINLLTNNKKFVHPRVNSLQIGPDISWSDNLIKAVNLIDSDYILFLYDDAFITSIKFPQFQNYINFCIEKDLPSLLLRPHNFRGKEKVSGDMFKINKDSFYRNSLFLNVIRKDVILSILRGRENAWQFEIIGNSRSKTYDFYAIDNNLAKYDHAIVKGKWFPAVLKKYQRKGYLFNPNRAIFSTATEFFYNLKYKIYITFYAKLFPLSIIRIVERVRSSESKKYIKEND